MSLDPESFLGASGHLIRSTGGIYANNPDGRAFRLRVHRYLWPTHWEEDLRVGVLSPEGVPVGQQTLIEGDAVADVQVPAGSRGVYSILLDGGGYRLFWLQCSLPRLVAACGTVSEWRDKCSCFVLHMVCAARRWYFFVPEGTSEFQLLCLHGCSHRQDAGLQVVSPRGQTVAAYYGSRPRLLGTHLRKFRHIVPRWDQRDEVPEPTLLNIETDSGSTGRFWSIWVPGGDGHRFSDLQIMLAGVPGYLSTMPEQWFNPETGNPAASVIYDYAIGPVQRTCDTICPPAPLLGDTDTGLLGPQQVVLFNPQGRPFDFHVTGHSIDGRSGTIRCRAFAPDGHMLLDQSRELFREHGLAFDRSPLSTACFPIPDAGAGRYRLEIDAERWYGWCEPCMPMGLGGAAGLEEELCFSLYLSIARHWYFQVPAGTQVFEVSVCIANPGQGVLVEVHAPDRMMQLLYVINENPARAVVTVPPGLDGRGWFVRLSVASAADLITDATARAMLEVNMRLCFHDLRVVLAPTWEQSFPA
jgi:hypothetical protein